MIVSAILALDKNNVLGKNNSLPWYIPEDLKLFKNITLNKVLVMGRNTLDSLPGLLPNREHIVVSKDMDFKVPKGVWGVSTLEDALSIATNLTLEKGYDEYFIIGGGLVVKQLIDKIDKIYLSRVDRYTEIDENTVVLDILNLGVDFKLVDKIDYEEFTQEIYVKVKN